MKLGLFNKLTIVNRFVLHTLNNNITRSAIKTLKGTIKIENLKGGESGKDPEKNEQMIRQTGGKKAYLTISGMCGVVVQLD